MNRSVFRLGGRWPDRLAVALAALVGLIVLPALALPEAGAREPTTPAVRWLGRVTAAPADRRIVVAQLVGGTTRLWAVPIDRPAGRVAIAEVDHRPGYGIAASVAPDGSRIAVVRLPGDRATAIDGGRLEAIDLGRGSVQTLADDVDPRAEPVWSPDGRQVLVDRRPRDGAVGRVHEVTLVTLDPEPRIDSLLAEPERSGWVGGIGWTPAGEVVAARLTPAGTDLLAIDPATHQSRTVGRLTDGVASVPQLSPDGRRVAFVAGRTSSGGMSYTVGVFDLATGQVQSTAESATPPWFAWRGADRLATGGHGLAPATRSAADPARTLPADAADAGAALGSGERVLPGSDPATLVVRRPGGGLAIGRVGGSPAEIDLEGYLTPVGWLNVGIMPVAAGRSADSSPPRTGGTGIIHRAWAAPAAQGDADHRCARTGAYPYQPRLAEVETVMDRAATRRLGPAYPQMPPIGAGLPPVDRPAAVPCVLLKAIGHVESGWRQAGYATPRGSSGDPLINPAGCAYGVGQIASGMQRPGEIDPALQYRIAHDHVTNVAYSARILADKWRATPAVGSNDPAIAEDWYYAVWAYNGFAYYNNPNNPRYDPNRPPFTGVQSFTLYPYQELVWGFAAHPAAPAGAPLWPAVPLTLPDRSNFPTDSTTPPGPIPNDPTPTHASVCPAARIGATPDRFVFFADPGRGVQPGTIALRDPFGASFAWQATPAAGWLRLGATAGASLPADLEFSVDPAGLPAGVHQTTVTVASPDGSFMPVTVAVELHVGPVARSFLPWVGRQAR